MRDEEAAFARPAQPTRLSVPPTTQPLEFFHTEGGSLTGVQRFGSSLNPNEHFHVIAMDGVYAQQPDESMLFHPLPAPSDEDIARLARAVCRKVTRYLKQLSPRYQARRPWARASTPIPRGVYTTSWPTILQ